MALPTKKIPQLPPAIALTGNELFETVQGGVSSQVSARAFVLPTDPLLTYQSVLGNLPGSRQIVSGAGIDIDMTTPGEFRISMLGTGALPAPPTALVGLNPVIGGLSTWMRSDSAPALSQAIAPTWTGQHTFSLLVAGITAGVVLASDNPGLIWIENDAAASNRVWDLVAAGEQLRGRVKTDDGLTVANWLIVDRTANVIDLISLLGPTTHSGIATFTAGTAPNTPSILLSSARPLTVWTETDASVDNRTWYADAQGEQFRLSLLNDAGNSSTIFLQVDRTAMVVDLFQVSSRQIHNAGGITTQSTSITVPGPNQNLDFTLGNEFFLTLTGNVTLAFTNAPSVPSGRTFTTTIYLRQDGTGSRLVTWPASVRWSDGITPVLTTTANRVDAVTLTSLDGGATYYGGQVLANMVP